MVKDISKVVSFHTVLNLPKIVRCKDCDTKFRGDEKKDLCPSCKSEKVSYCDAFDFDNSQITSKIKSVIKEYFSGSISDMLSKLGVSETIKLERIREIRKVRQIRKVREIDS